MRSRLLLTAFLLPWLGTAAVAQPLLPPGEKEPFLRLEAGGPTSLVTALAFSADGQRLYAAGWDKVVRVWGLDRERGKFILERGTYRVPIGPGENGALNAMALSSDGTWLAVGGRGVLRGESGFRDAGIVVPTALGGMTDEMRQDRGMIYVFNTKTQEVRLLRGHWGQILSLAFTQDPGQPPLLASACEEWDSKTGHYTGCVRLWDVTKGPGDLARLRDLPNPGSSRPGLVLWQTDKEKNAVRVAIAWGDGNFRLWEVAGAKQQLWTEPDGRYNLALGYLPSPPRAVTASFHNPNGHLQLWDLLPEQAPKADARQKTAFAFETIKGTQLFFYPRTLTLCSSTPGGPVDLAAVVLRAPAGGEEYQLRLVDLSPQNFGAVQARVVLWKGGVKLPVLAAAPGGKYLAAAGNEAQDIRIYAIPDLLKRAGEPQRLRGAGAPIRQVAFVTRAAKDQKRALGLVLSEAAGEHPGRSPRPLQAGDVLFDFARRALTVDRKGWEPAAPPLDGWSAELATVKGRHVLSVSHQGQAIQRIEMSVKQVVADWALLPPRKDIGFPLLAVAYLDEGRPRLYLYNARSGKPIRQLTGHSERVRSVAFAPDGKLLASAGDDQTVCVWSLSNRDRILGQRGILEGVAVRSSQGAVVVSRAFTDPTTAAAVQPGDVIEGTVEDGKLQPLASLLPYYEAIALRKPGSKVTLRVRTGPASRDAVLVVAQGIDERKPLLSLFVTRADPRGAREWIGWNPIGPYDSSGPQAERLLGWHFNTGQADAPTRFAYAHEYRKEYRREGILDYLVARGNLNEAVEDWVRAIPPLPVPAPTLWIDEIGPDARADAQGHMLVRPGQRTLKLSLDNFPPDPEKVASLEWQLDDRPPRKMKHDSGREWSADLSQAPWERGVHKVRVVLRTQEFQPKEHSREITLRYQPLPPVVKLTAPAAERLTVKEAAYTVEGEVSPGQKGEAVQVQLRVRHQNEDLLAPAQRAQGLKIKQTLTLRPGDNQVEIVAVNKGALAGFEDAETARVFRVVTYQPPKVVPSPAVVLRQLVPLPDGAARPIEPGQTPVVDSPRVRIVGRISAEDVLARAVWVLGEADPRKAGKPLTGFAAGTAKTWAIAEDLTLEPGRNPLRVLARTATSTEGEAVLTIDYQPPLPRVVLLEPRPGLVLYEGKDPRAVALKGRLVLPRNPRAFTRVLLVNGKGAGPLALDEKTQELSARVVLAPGDNRIQVRLSNAWNAAAASEELMVSYLRPPSQVAFEKPQPGPKPFIDLVARAQSPLPLLSESVQATVNGRPITSVEVVAPGKADGTTWRVRLKEVPLVPGPNEVVLWVSNREAQCLSPATVSFRYEPPAPPAPPEVAILDPRSDTPVPEPRVAVRFRVRSASPIKSVELVREIEGRARERLAVTVPRIVAKNGVFELVGRTDVQVTAGVNRIALHAINDGGKQYTPAVVLTYSPRPVGLVIEKLEARGLPPVVPMLQPGSELVFPALPHGQVRVHGRVSWDAPNDSQFRNIYLAQLEVNGFQQAPAILTRQPGKRQATFQADIVLNRSERNHITVALPGLKQDAANRRSFTVACAKPIRGQRLHLLIVGLTEKDETKLTTDVLNSLQVKPSPQGRLQSPAFEEVLVYGPLTDYLVTPGKVFEQLRKIERTIDRQSAAGAPNDVVLVYYHGGEALDPSQQCFFETSNSQRDRELRRSAISCDALLSRLAETRGMQVLLLDVACPSSSSVEATGDLSQRTARWLSGSRVGMLRYAWLNGGEAPRLLEDLQKEMGPPGRLQDVADRMSTRHRPGTSGSFVFDRHLPEGPANLAIAQKP